MDEIQVGDRVCWPFSGTGLQDTGVVQEIINDRMVIIYESSVPRYRNSMTAKKRDGKWFANRSYQGYLQEIIKIESQDQTKARFEQALTELLEKCREIKMRHYVPTAEEFAFFILAQKFWPEMVESLLEEFDFECSGAGAVFIRK